MQFSIIVPTYARPRRIAACLAGLAALDYPRDGYEVVIVDDGTPGGLELDLSNYRQRLNVRVINQKHAGPAEARNRGAQEAAGEYLAFTDDDCVPDPIWLKAFAAAIAAAPGDLFGGRVINVLDSLYSQASQDVVSYICTYYDGMHGRPRLFTSNNMVLPAAAFRDIGGFNTSFERAAGEDREFCDRWVAAGRGSRYVPEAVVHHAHSLSFAGFCRQHFHYGRAAVRYRQIRAARRGERMRVERASFYWDLLRFPLVDDRSFRGGGRAVLVGVSQALNAAGFYWETLRQGSRKGR
jgi:GT2 family glycosyltransferase